MSILDNLFNALRPVGGQHTPEELYPGTDVEIEFEGDEPEPAKPFEITYPVSMSPYHKEEEEPKPVEKPVEFLQPLAEALPRPRPTLQQLVDEDENRMFRVEAFMNFDPRPREPIMPAYLEETLGPIGMAGVPDMGSYFQYENGGIFEDGAGESIYDPGCDPCITCGY